MNTCHPSRYASAMRTPATSWVLALHCSGASGRQWDRLAKGLSPSMQVIAPDFYGSGDQRPWAGSGPFSLGKEAAHAISLIDEIGGPIHLVGHSYGGAVALKIAVARPLRIATLSLYEPVAFHVLKSMGPDGRTSLQQIEELAALFDACVLTGDYETAARHFADFWSGEGSWEALKPETRLHLTKYVPKGCLEFRAVLSERAPLVAYARLRIPTLLMHGQTPNPAVVVTRKLAQLMRPCRSESIQGAGHMGPPTHYEVVSPLVANHIASWESAPAMSVAA